MSDLETIRGAIVARLAAVPGIGAVHRYQRYTAWEPGLRRLYESNGTLLGWSVRRVATAERADAASYNQVVHRWRIEGVMSLNDEAASELAFDALIEAIRDAFRADETLGGAVETTAVDGQAGPQLEDSGPAKFSGVLCHHARLGLATVVSAGTGPGGGEALDDFATGGMRWDLAPPDGATEAEDKIELEVETAP